MLLVELWMGSQKMDSQPCDKGNLLPTIATLMQKHEAEHGWKHGQEYAISWKIVKE